MERLIFKVPIPGVPTWELVCHAEQLTQLNWTQQPPNRSQHPLLQEAQQQLMEYLAGQRTAFTLPLACAGPAFFQKVWAALENLPYGVCLSYGELAAAVGNPKASRAVGSAMKANPLPIFRPCHRITQKGRAFAPGYSFGGPLVQKFLLQLEQSTLGASWASKI